MKWKWRSIISLMILLSTDIPFAADQDLAKQAQNPIADMISLPLQNNTNFNYGPLNRTQNTLNVQPVYPFSISKDWNLITRTIIPLTYQPTLSTWNPPIPTGKDSTFGIGNTTITAYISPKNSGNLLWGAAPVLMFPASNDQVGSRAWGLGASAVILATPGQWVIGSTFSNVWSINGSDNDKLNLFTWQYFINYNLPEGWYLTSSPIITANWENSSGNKWTIPFGAGFGKIFTIGKQPFNASLQSFYNVETPRFGPDWSLRFQLTFLFPK